MMVFEILLNFAGLVTGKQEGIVTWRHCLTWVLHNHPWKHGRISWNHLVIRHRTRILLLLLQVRRWDWICSTWHRWQLGGKTDICLYSTLVRLRMLHSTGRIAAIGAYLGFRMHGISFSMHFSWDEKSPYYTIRGSSTREFWNPCWLTCTSTSFTDSDSDYVAHDVESNHLEWGSHRQMVQKKKKTP